MTALGWYLLLILLASAGTFGLVRLWSGPVGRGNPKPLLLLHATLVVLLSIGAVLWFLGWQPTGAAPEVEAAPYRLEHTGFYVAEGKSLGFRSDRTERAVLVPALQPGEWFELAPKVRQERAGELSWTLRAAAWALPLRFNGECVNLPQDRWFLPGDTLMVQDPRNGHFFSVQWTTDEGHGEVKNRWLYNQGALENGRPVADLDAPAVLEDRALGEGLRLSAMAGHRLARAIRTLENAGGEPALRWWERLLPRRGPERMRLRSGVTLADFKGRYRDLAPHFDKVLWVRRSLSRPESPIGVFLDPALFEGRQVLRISAAGARMSLTSGPSRQAFEEELAAGSQVRYGFGEREAFSLVLDGRRENVPELGLVASLRLATPPSWRLPSPPTAELMILSREVLIPVPALRLDVGLDREPFYAKARYRPERGGFEVNDGRDFLGVQRGMDRPLLGPGDIFRLGGAERGVMLRFLRQGSPVAYPGLWAAVFLAVAGLAFAGSLAGDPTVRLRLDLAWTLLWGLGVALLVVRLVLSYRIAVLPPLDASPLEVRNVFEKSFRVALIALAWVPLALALVRVAARLPRPVVRIEQAVRGLAANLVASTQARNLTARLTAFAAVTPLRRSLRNGLLALPRGLAMAGFVLVAWLVAGTLLARNEAIAGVRVNIVAHLLIILGIAAGADWITRSHPRSRLLFAAAWLLVPGLLVVGPTHDLGFAIHFLTFLLLTIVLLAWDRQRRSWLGTTALVTVFALLVLSPLILDRALSLPVVNRWVTRTFDPGSSHVYYRLATPDTYDDVLVRPAEEEAYSMTYFLRNSQQHWQMMLYAAEGAHAPRGYGGAPMSQAGMTYPTAMSDCVYAVHLLAEHGSSAALLLLLVYAAIAAVLVYASAFLLDSWRSRALVFLAVGAYFSLTAFYMASANLGLLVFTGQNMPLLSLHSRSDLLAGVALLGMMTFLLRFRLNGDRSVAFRQQPWVKRIACGYLIFLAVAWIGLAVHLHGVAVDNNLRRDFTLPRNAYESYESHLPESGKAKPLELRGEDLRVIAPQALSWPEKQFLRAFELQSDRYDPLAGFYYLEAGDDGPRVRINRSYLNLSSPFSPPSPWRGTIEAKGRELPTVNLLGEGVSLRPGEPTSGETIVLNGRTPPKEEASASVVLAWRRGGQVLSLCELVTGPAGFSVTPYVGDGSRGVNFQVYVDGERITRERSLVGKEVIRITGATTRDRPERFAYSLMYLGPRVPTLAFTTWRNGRERRIVSDSSLAGLVEDLGQALDARQRDKSALLPERVMLTVDDSLHQRLEETLAQQMETIYRDDDPPSRRRGASLAVLDATSGEILALPSLPSWKLPETAASSRRNERESRVYLRNDNLRNHVIGSTIKPILLAAVATGYWPAGFDVGRLEVNNASDCAPSPSKGRVLHSHCTLAGVRLDTPWDCMQPPDGVIDERTFLVQSRNFYAGILGMLGMALDPSDWRHILRVDTGVQEGTSVIYGGASYRVNLTWAPPQGTAFTFDDLGPPRPKAAELGKTLLFRQIPALFEVEPDLQAGDRDEYKAYRERKIKAFYPALRQTNLYDSPGVELVMPDLISLRPGLFHSTRQDLLSFFLGGGTAGRWNNVRLAEAAARIITGRKVVAHLGARIGEMAAPNTPAAPSRPDPTLPSDATPSLPADLLPKPLSDPTWRRTYLVEPLGLVGRVGTAKELESLVTQAEAEGFRILMKTGTLEELVPLAGSARQRFESELLLFVVGRWQSEGFVPGQAVAGVLYLEDSKPVEVHHWSRTGVARPILQALLEHLRRRSREATLPPPIGAPGN